MKASETNAGSASSLPPLASPVFARGFCYMSLAGIISIKKQHIHHTEKMPILESAPLRLHAGQKITTSVE
eukprot:scaffold514_cov90-Cylindrotheca_fusiformis.AAC.2